MRGQDAAHPASLLLWLSTVPCFSCRVGCSTIGWHTELQSTAGSVLKLPSMKRCSACDSAWCKALALVLLLKGQHCRQPSKQLVGGLVPSKAVEAASQAMAARLTRKGSLLHPRASLASPPRRSGCARSACDCPWSPACLVGCLRALAGLAPACAMLLSGCSGCLAGVAAMRQQLSHACSRAFTCGAQAWCWEGHSSTSQSKQVSACLAQVTPQDAQDSAAKGLKASGKDTARQAKAAARSAGKPHGASSAEILKPAASHSVVPPVLSRVVGQQHMSAIYLGWPDLPR